MFPLSALPAHRALFVRFGLALSAVPALSRLVTGVFRGVKLRQGFRGGMRGGLRGMLYGLGGYQLCRQFKLLLQPLCGVRGRKRGGFYEGVVDRDLPGRRWRLLVAGLDTPRRSVMSATPVFAKRLLAVSLGCFRWHRLC